MSEEQLPNVVSDEAAPMTVTETGNSSKRVSLHVLIQEDAPHDRAHPPADPMSPISVGPLSPKSDVAVRNVMIRRPGDRDDDQDADLSGEVPSPSGRRCFGCW
jgi:hypothetical protein